MQSRSTIKERLDFLQITEHTHQALTPIAEALEASIEAALDQFYAHILAEPKVKALFPDEASIVRARRAQKSHWLEALFSDDPGQSLHERAERIATAHVAIRLSPSWYLSGYCFMINQFVVIVAEHFAKDPVSLVEAVQAINKMSFLDMHCVVDSYLEEKNGLMLSILQRATRFAEDLEGIAKEIYSAQTALDAKLEALDAHGFDNATTLKHEVRHERYALRNQVDSLMQRLDQLMLEDRLYTPLHQKSSIGTLGERIKQFADRYLGDGFR